MTPPALKTNRELERQVEMLQRRVAEYQPFADAALSLLPEKPTQATMLPSGAIVQAEIPNPISETPKTDEIRYGDINKMIASHEALEKQLTATQIALKDAERKARAFDKLSAHGSIHWPYGNSVSFYSEILVAEDDFKKQPTLLEAVEAMKGYND